VPLACIGVNEIWPGPVTANAAGLVGGQPA
jgi:hypothetical protein